MKNKDGEIICPKCGEMCTPCPNCDTWICVFCWDVVEEDENDDD